MSYSLDIQNFGSGIDGDVTIGAGTTTLSRTMYYNNLTVPAGATLNFATRKVYVKNTLTIESGGVIRGGFVNGNNAVNGAGGGTSAAIVNSDMGTGSAGGAGPNGSVGAGVNGSAGSAVTGMGGAGAVGGNGGSGVAGTVAGGTGGNASVLTLRLVHNLGDNFSYGAITTNINGGGGGSGGGAGGGDGVSAGGGGGGGAAGTAPIFIMARIIINNGTINGDGGIGGNGGNAVGANAGGGGGGSGSGGGFTYIVYTYKSGSGTITTAGGAGGAGGAGNGTGAPGSTGATGAVGQKIEINLANQLVTVT